MHNFFERREKIAKKGKKGGDYEKKRMANKKTCAYRRKTGCLMENKKIYMKS